MKFIGLCDCGRVAIKGKGPNRSCARCIIANANAQRLHERFEGDAENQQEYAIDHERLLKAQALAERGLKKTLYKTTHDYIPRNLPRRGELPIKTWVAREAERLSLTIGSLWNYILSGRYPYPPVRKVNSRVIFVKVSEQLKRNERKLRSLKSN